MTAPRTTAAGYEDVEAWLRKRTVMDCFGMTRPDEGCIEAADALADMRRQRDEANAELIDEVKLGCGLWNNLKAAKAQLTEARQVIAAAKQAIDDGDTDDARDFLDAIDAAPPEAPVTRYERGILVRQLTEARAEVERLTDERRAMSSRNAKLNEEACSQRRSIVFLKADVERLTRERDEAQVKAETCFDQNEMLAARIIAAESESDQAREECDEACETAKERRDEAYLQEIRADRYKALAEGKQEGLIRLANDLRIAPWVRREIVNLLEPVPDWNHPVGLAFPSPSPPEEPQPGIPDTLSDDTKKALADVDALQASAILHGKDILIGATEEPQPTEDRSDG